ncbi:hypothetical protein V6N12_052055 [Hibiscus sabdariffa]|uniref:Disease resistance protein RGA3 n=1 Tax=Hibiscus sabdariffa TaxID=183260 RepID=A0ABR2GH43_9ROSI
MAEAILSEAVASLVLKLGSLAIEEIKSPKGLGDEVKKLEATMSTIKAVLLDAEERQSRNHELQNWLWKLKDACYDLEDVLEEFEIASTRTGQHRSFQSKVRRFFSRSNPVILSFNMARKVKGVRENLDGIAADRSKFHLMERVDSRRIIHRERDMTHSFIRTSDVIGRDDDIENIIDILVHQDEDRDLLVIPVVGIGGLGKTTVAKTVYNDERIDFHFDLKLWVCVSSNFDVAKLTREICSLATSKNCSDLTIEQLQYSLRSSLVGNRFLLVLDDLWNDNRAKWIELQDLLFGGALGSKIIVTTRSPLVATITGNVPAYNLTGLSQEDCLSLFLKWAFNEGKEKQHPNLVEIGREIVKKCGGVPLAVRTLGSLLYSTIDEREWLSIRDSEIWKLKQRDNDILPVLKLSYDQMQPYLKQCFALCSMFPKNYLFYSFELIQFWMAHGLLQPVRENKELEDIGLQYMKELCSVSFLQVVEDHEFFFTCKMHDLIHDLSLSVAQNECCTINSLAEHVPEKVRHLSFPDTSFLSHEVPKCLLQSNRVRTMFFPIKGVAPSSESFISLSISRFKYLRVLNLSDLCLEVLPMPFGTLKHLRYFDLLRNNRIKKLPESICSLHNLQTLRLEDCNQLEEIPQGIGSLINLRFLEITTKQSVLPENGMECLTSLRFLSFFECHNLKHLFEGIRCFSALQTLVLASCPSLTSLPRSIRYLTSLETLVIGDCGNLNLVDEQDNEDCTLRLRSLLLGELQQLVALPQWLCWSACSLQYLYIDDCPNFVALPDWFEDCKSLRKLELLRCPDLSSLPEGLSQLSSLQTLKIGHCPILLGRCKMVIGEDWPKIAHVPEIYLDGLKV